ncbi:MAG: hypothetical protein IPG32_03195 [Saprospirales bacterium]|nr:hypothetical protein [Saprospirales bacterium]
MDDDLDALPPFFKEAPEELPLSTNLTTLCITATSSRSGSPNQRPGPACCFDLNMPGKTASPGSSRSGLTTNSKSLPVFIFSTAFDQDMLNLVYKDAAHYYIRASPPNFPYSKM